LRWGTSVDHVVKNRLASTSHSRVKFVHQLGGSTRDNRLRALETEAIAKLGFSFVY
jgi:DNA-binding transcriptional regulator LsrR (DeoR family)